MAKRINATIIDPVGLYATPATKLVDTMKLFKSDIKLIELMIDEYDPLNFWENNFS